MEYESKYFLPLLFFRSLLFNIAFYLNCCLWFLLAISSWPFSSSETLWFARKWAKTSVFIHRWIIGSPVEFRGLDNIPEGALFVAAKHYSAWETIALLLFFPKATYILKQELLKLPLFGRHLIKAGQIPIDRKKGTQAFIKMQQEVKKAISDGRQIIIFPEGTRRNVGDAPEYKFGVARLYAQLNAPCLPVAMTSGLSWPANSFIHYPRPIIVEFLPVIPAGLPTDVFFEKIKSEIENNTSRLLQEAGYISSKDNL